MVQLFLTFVVQHLFDVCQFLGELTEKFVFLIGQILKQSIKSIVVVS